MATNAGTVTLHVHFANREAVADFLEAQQLVEEAAGELLWRDDLRTAVERMKSAFKGLELRRE